MRRWHSDLPAMSRIQSGYQKRKLRATSGARPMRFRWKLRVSAITETRTEYLRKKHVLYRKKALLPARVIFLSTCTLRTALSNDSVISKIDNMATVRNAPDANSEKEKKPLTQQAKPEKDP